MSKNDPGVEQETIDPRTLIETLRRLQTRIPDYTQLTNQQVIVMRRASTLDPDWVYQTVGAVGASPEAEAALGTTHVEMRDEIEEQHLWERAEREAQILFKGLGAANLVRRHRIGLRALQAYGILRQLLRQPEHHHLRTHVEQLREMNRTGKRKKKEEEAVQA